MLVELRAQVRRVLATVLRQLDVTIGPRARRDVVTEVVDKLIEEKREFALLNMFRAHRLMLKNVLTRL